MFFDDLTGLLRVPIVGVLAYAALLATLRFSGKRTLSQMNAFDLVVTVALGSTLATVLLSKDVALAEGVVALVLLVGLQYGIAWLSVRSQLVADLVKAEPTLLLYRGEIIESMLRRERVTRSEVQEAVRAQGLASPRDVFAVVLETNGNFSVIGEDSRDPLPGIDVEKQAGNQQ